MSKAIDRNTLAAIWDMDGVIVDSGPYHRAAWQQVFRRRGVSFTPEDFRRHFGQRNDTIIRSTLGQGIAPAELEAIIRDKEAAFRDSIKGQVRALPGALALLRSLRENGFKLALASSAPPENIGLLTGELGIRPCFHAIVAGPDVAEGKPSPQAFRLAARRLGVAPENCVVLEDAVAGVAAAKRAGMACLAVTNTHPRESLREADLVVDSLAAVSVARVAGLLPQH
ncbi:MAG: HAD family phosphatase [Chloroflexota bacterium]